MKDDKVIIKSANIKLVNALKDQQAADDIANHIISNRKADKALSALGIKCERTVSDVLTTISESFEMFGIYRNDSYCGYVELSDKEAYYELGIDIIPEFQKCGIGTEAIISFCDHIYKEYDVKTIKLRIMANNTASIRFFEKLGARYEGKKPFVEGLEKL